MKKQVSLRAISGATLAIILVLAAAQIPALGQGKARRLEGTWRTEGTVINCQTGATIRTFLGLDVILNGGSMLATGSSSPALTSTGYGVWEHVGGRNFTNTI